MVDDSRNFLGMAFENGHNLFCVLLKYHCILIGPAYTEVKNAQSALPKEDLADQTCKRSSGISREVQSKDSRNTGTVQTLQELVVDLGWL